MVDGADALGVTARAAPGIHMDGATADRNLLRRKYMRFFEILDVDDDGVVTESDVIELGRKLAEAGDDGASPSAFDLSIALTELWPVGDPSLADGREMLGRDDVAQTLFGYVERRPDTAITVIGQLANILFAASDHDGDERISKDEFMQMETTVFSVSGVEAEEAWSKVDALKRDYLAYPEYLTAVTEFMTSLDPRSPGNWIFGRV